MVLMEHFIDHQWKMRKMILNFCQIPNHKGDTIGKAIATFLRGCGIDKVFAITVDNASSNNVTIVHIKKRLQIWKTVICNVRYAKASPKRLGRFQRSVKNMCKEEKAFICLDVATSWNSTYFMLDRAIKYSDAFKLFEEEDRFYM
ncbi:unnamed protein product [Lactuca saligna]|uniref:Uncharacterized protein n=1 Tax=Lactuca saligna TaxID=75948 RepID=A0AA35YW79_LACSI|nr:unnamed protein product [Lactuca saligna]